MTKLPKPSLEITVTLAKVEAALQLNKELGSKLEELLNELGNHGTK